MEFNLLGPLDLGASKEGSFSYLQTYRSLLRLIARSDCLRDDVANEGPNRLTYSKRPSVHELVSALWARGFRDEGSGMPAVAQTPTLPAGAPAGDFASAVGYNALAVPLNRFAIPVSSRIHQPSRTPMGRAGELLQPVVGAELQLLEVPPERDDLSQRKLAKAILLACERAGLTSIADLWDNSVFTLSIDGFLLQTLRECMLRLVEGIRAALRLMLVLVLAVLARRPDALSAALFLLATARCFGHRGEPDHHVLSALMPISIVIGKTTGSA
jgi:hypothetical protein